MAYASLIIFVIAIGMFLSLSTYVFSEATGRFMVAVGALASLSAYVTVIVSNSGQSIWLGLGAGLSASAAVGVAIGIFSRRLAPEDFLLVALAISEVVRRLAFHCESATGGAYGLRLNTAWAAQAHARFYLPGLLAILAGWGLQRWFRTGAGLRWRITGGAREAAAMLGTDPRHIEVLSGAAMGLIGGLAGVVYVLGFRYIHPDDLGINMSLAALAVALSARPRWLLIDVCVLSLVLFGLRDILRLVEVGGIMRFAVHDLVLGIVLIVAAVRLGGTSDGR